MEKEMATHSRIPAWRIPWTEEPSGLVSGSQELDTTEQISKHTHHIFFIQSSTGGFLHLFSILAIADNTAMNIGLHISFQISVFVFLE